MRSWGLEHGVQNALRELESLRRRIDELAAGLKGVPPKGITEEPQRSAG